MIANITSKVLAYIVSALILFGAGYGLCYFKTVPSLNAKINALQKQVAYYAEKDKIVTAVSADSKDEISYVVKSDKNDADVEINDTKPVVKVKVNGDTVAMPSKLTETHKFEQGKLVVDKHEDYVFDMTDTFNKAVSSTVSAKSRVGKLDVGGMYVKDSGVYGGLRYNAKMFDVGGYTNGKSGYVIAIHGKF